MKTIFKLFKDTLSEFSEDKATRLAAALSYYTVVSLAPMVIIAITIASIFFTRSQAQGQLMAQIQNMIGPTGAEAIKSILDNASQPGSGGVFATISSVVVLIFGASGVFSQLQDSLNVLWDVEPKPGAGILATIKERFFSFTLVLGIGFLLMVSLILNTALTALGTYFSNLLPAGGILWQVINFLISFGVITLLFALMFKYLPDVEVSWKHVWIGAIMTALLFNIGKTLIGLYLGRSTAASAYGAAGSLIIVLLWVYYSALILFFGAEFTQVYSTQKSGEVVPKNNARFLSPAKRAAQGLRTNRPPMGRPAILDEANPDYDSPTAYPASRSVVVRRGEPGLIPATGGPVPPEVMKVVPVLALGALAAGFGLFQGVRAGVDRLRHIKR